MQVTRQHILEILKEAGECTVDEIVDALAERMGYITAVTVRYHLDILKNEGLLKAARVKRRRSPGRPQYIYTLTEDAHAFFPKNYQSLTAHILEELKHNLPPAQVRVIMERVAQRMAQEALVDGVGALEDSMARAAAYLNEKGYQASWEKVGRDGYMLHINNCPYRQVVDDHAELCAMDARLLTNILGKQPGCVGTIAQGQDTCTYHLAGLL